MARLREPSRPSAREQEIKKELERIFNVASFPEHSILVTEALQKVREDQAQQEYRRTHGPGGHRLKA